MFWTNFLLDNVSKSFGWSSQGPPPKNQTSEPPHKKKRKIKSKFFRIFFQQFASNMFSKHFCTSSKTLRVRAFEQKWALMSDFSAAALNFLIFRRWLQIRAFSFFIPTGSDVWFFGGGSKFSDFSAMASNSRLFVFDPNGLWCLIFRRRL